MRILDQWEAEALVSWERIDMLDKGIPWQGSVVSRYVMSESCLKISADRILTLIKALRRQEEALKFYSDDSNYVCIHDDCKCSPGIFITLPNTPDGPGENDIELDCGVRAELALAEVEKLLKDQSLTSCGKLFNIIAEPLTEEIK